MMRKTPLLAAALLACALASVQAHADGSFVTVPFAIYSLSGDGRAASGSNLTQTEAYMWSAATGLSTSMGPDTFGQYHGFARINYDGSRIGSTRLDPSDGYYHVGFYDTATTQFTAMPGGLGGTPNAGSGYAYGLATTISGDGGMVAGYGQAPGGTSQNYLNAALWNTSTGVATSLGTPGEVSRVNSLSYDGKVVGGYYGNGRPVVWTDLDGDGNYTRTNLGAVGGATVASIGAISKDGTWAVGASQGLSGAYRYNVLTQQSELLPLVNAGWQSEAQGVSADGKTVIGFETNRTTSERKGFIWQEGIGTLSLDTYLASQGIDVGNSFEFRVPTGLSADGHTIGGYGVFTNGTINTGFIVNISAVPEPSTYALLIAGLGTVAFMARRRRAASNSL